MLRIAGAAVAFITVLQIMVLWLLVKTDLLALSVLVAAFNMALAFLVGYFTFNSVTLSTQARPREDALQIVQDTLPILRQGLNQQTAAKVAQLVSQLGGVLAVVITDNRQEILAAAGPGWQETAWRDLVSKTAKRAVFRGESKVSLLPAPPGWPLPAPPRETKRAVRKPLAAILVPLKAQRNVVGSLALMTHNEPQLLAELTRSGNLCSQFLSMQVQLAQLDRQAQLAAEAELNALRAQINPHFLFNTLNTIVSYSREEPDMARRLLLRLSDLFRTTMNLNGQIIPFAEEYQHVKNYLFIEQARFRDRLRISYDIDPQVLKVGVPALSVQPLVENAIRHGIAPKKGVGQIAVAARLDFILLRLLITVRDDGVGIPADRIPELLKPRPSTGPSRPAGRGVGLANINERLKRLYGEAYSLQIESRPGDTRVHMRIPMR